jgi:AAA15 family ATPase/GTPase
MVTWYHAYPELAARLLAFYKKNRRRSGQVLFRLTQKNAFFLHRDEWLVSRSRSTKGNRLDPIHVFSSFNRPRQPEKLRMEFFHAWFSILGGKYSSDRIDFAGCPTPIAIKSVGVREPEADQEIWASFAKIVEGKQAALDEDMFKELKGWYGIDVPLFTIFLFWIEPKYFLPLDRNTENLLHRAEIIKSLPRAFPAYRNLLVAPNSMFYINMAKFAFNPRASEPGQKQMIEQIRRKYNRSTRRVGADFDFKVVAIRPLSGMAKEHLKVLESDKVYTFYQEFKFLENGKVKYSKGAGFNFYNHGGLQISVSAIVGKNGSGKSTLSELLFLAVNNIAAAFGDPRIRGQVIHKRGVNVELYFHQGTLYRARLIGKRISLVSYTYGDGQYTIARGTGSPTIDLNDFFYTLGINYSLYGLNSRELGEWVAKVFHKNDGYQVPLAISPFRKEGNFDVNSENDLVRSRLLANILEPIDPKDENNLRVITDNGRSVKKLCFSLNQPKIKTLRQEKYANSAVIVDMFKRRFDLSNRRLPKDIVTIADLYIVSKLHRICENYAPYQRFLIAKRKALNLRLLPELFDELSVDPSHIAYKIKQVINLFRYYRPERLPLDKPIDIEQVSRRIEDIKRERSRRQSLKTIELIPPSFFACDFILNDRSHFKDLSSGEKQKIYTVSSIVYHLSNLNSVSADNNLITYAFVNVIFDEIELYFHPEMQRTFLQYLLSYLGKTDLGNIKALNFSFITHSPFILSDLSTQNVLYLDEKGKQDRLLNERKTFGGNIHELLAHSFFLEDKGYMGAFATGTIQSLIRYLEADGRSTTDTEQGESHWTRASAQSMIDAIGEPLIRSSMQELFLIKFRDDFTDDNIEREIERLQRLKQERK